MHASANTDTARVRDRQRGTSAAQVFTARRCRARSGVAPLAIVVARNSVGFGRRSAALPGCGCRLHRGGRNETFCAGPGQHRAPLLTFPSVAPPRLVDVRAVERSRSGVERQTVANTSNPPGVTGRRSTRSAGAKAGSVDHLTRCCGGSPMSRLERRRPHSHESGGAPARRARRPGVAPRPYRGDVSPKLEGATEVRLPECRPAAIRYGRNVTGSFPWDRCSQPCTCTAFDGRPRRACTRTRSRWRL